MELPQLIGNWDSSVGPAMVEIKRGLSVPCAAIQSGVGDSDLRSACLLPGLTEDASRLDRVFFNEVDGPFVSDGHFDLSRFKVGWWSRRPFRNERTDYGALIRSRIINEEALRRSLLGATKWFLKRRDPNAVYAGLAFGSASSTYLPLRLSSFISVMNCAEGAEDCVAVMTQLRRSFQRVMRLTADRIDSGVAVLNDVPLRVPGNVQRSLAGVRVAFTSGRRLRSGTADAASWISGVGRDGTGAAPVDDYKAKLSSLGASPKNLNDAGLRDTLLSELYLLEFDVARVEMGGISEEILVQEIDPRFWLAPRALTALLTDEMRRSMIAFEQAIFLPGGN